MDMAYNKIIEGIEVKNIVDFLEKLLDEFYKMKKMS